MDKSISKWLHYCLLKTHGGKRRSSPEEVFSSVVSAQRRLHPSNSVSSIQKSICQGVRSFLLIISKNLPSKGHVLLLWNLNALHEKEQIQTSKAAALSFMGLLKVIMKTKFSLYSAFTAEAKSVDLTTRKRSPETQYIWWTSNLASSLSLAFKWANQRQVTVFLVLFGSGTEAVPVCWRGRAESFAPWVKALTWARESHVQNSSCTRTRNLEIMLETNFERTFSSNSNDN